jgi:hypothetical protein
MTFNPIAGSAVASLLPYLPENPCVVELGNQTFTVSDEVLLGLIEMLERQGKSAVASNLRAFVGRTAEDKAPLTEAFYRALGFSAYLAMDINHKYGSVIMDLNRDLKADYQFRDTFDLVTNNGTGEHVFNQYMIFRNVHQLTKVGGMMLHIMPFGNYVNHGFYNFQPVLFADLAAANGYIIRKLGIANRWGVEVPVELMPNGQSHGYPGNGSSVTTAEAESGQGLLRASEAFVPPSPKGSRMADAFHFLATHGPNPRSHDLPGVLVVAAMQKTSDEPFAIPMQGKYVQDIQDVSLSSRYQAGDTSLTAGLNGNRGAAWKTMVKNILPPVCYHLIQACWRELRFQPKFLPPFLSDLGKSSKRKSGAAS